VTLAMALIIALVGVFVVRLADIQLVQAAELNEQSQNKREIVQTTYGDRGDITDVDGTVLAGSVTRYNITAAPAFATTAKVKGDDGKTTELTVDQVVERIAKITGGDAATMTKALTTDPEANFAYLVKSTPSVRSAR
jgi:cell division protein FtsI (penicillin-binding protein 3)